MKGLIDARRRYSTVTSAPARPLRARLVRGLVFAGAGVFAGFVVVRALPVVVRSDFLPVRNVVVEGADPVRIPEIVAYAQVADGAPLFSLDVDDVQQRVAEHPYVREASVRRVPPDTVEIRVIERQPYAVLSTHVPYLLDETIVPFKRVQPGDPVDLPVITGLLPNELGTEASVRRLELAFDIIRLHRDLGAPGGRIDEINVATEGARLVLEGGLTVQVGSEHLLERLTRLATVLERSREIGREPEFVFLDDARRPERVAVRFRSSTEVSTGTGG
jgi:cell division protein FtsQ